MKQEELQKAKKRQRKWYDKKHMKAPDFKVGDELLLDRYNIHSKWPSQKLDHKEFGPFKVIKNIGLHVFRIELPLQWMVHDVFSV